MTEQATTPEQAGRGEQPPYTVVVGVSATSKSPSALAWAQAQAQQNGGRVIAVRAWKTPAPQAPPAGTTHHRIPSATAVEDEVREALTADVAAALGPDHTVELRVVRGGTFRVLTEAAEEADLLVVDAPRQLLVGPMFAHRLIYATACPVVVMPADPATPSEPSRLAKVAGAIGRGVVTAAGTAGRPGYRPPLRT